MESGFVAKLGELRRVTPGDTAENHDPDREGNLE
jgi:hypothetical protein